MKMYIHKITLIMLIFTSGVFAQGLPSSDYYYYNGQKVPLHRDNSYVHISVAESFDKSNLNTQFVKPYTLKSENTSYDGVNRKWSKLLFKRKLSQQEFEQTIKLIQNSTGVETVSPSYLDENGLEIGMSSYFYIKLNSPSDINQLERLASQNKVVIIEQNEFMPLWFTLQCTKMTPNNTLKTANYFYEFGGFAAAVPDFLTNDLHCANDTDFSQLWGLQNTSNPQADIDACDAWTITEGSGVHVAVLDHGIELTHNDLQANISPLSYDTESNTSPSQIFGSHGTHVSGTIGAVKDNNLQVAGVAPQSTLMSISNSLLGTPNSRIKRADGINWAWQNGAAIISNSWGSGVMYQVIDDAIDNALMNGRGGLGTIVVFSAGNSGNTGSPQVNYPANSNPDIIAVGSITSAGLRSSFSSYSSELDVVAPGSGILSTVLNNGTAVFSGTSMAAPHVSGIAALILSVNPSLTGDEVRDIIELTSQKIGGYNYTTQGGRPNGTWDGEMGYGLVNAYEAVLMAQSNTCPQDLVITQDVINGSDIKEAQNTITASNNIFNNANAEYDAGISVSMIPGFHARAGSTYRAYIEGCNSPKPSSKKEEIIDFTFVPSEKDSFATTAKEAKIYPNPTRNTFNLISEDAMLQWELTNQLGNVRLGDTFRNVHETEINIDRYPAGIYFLKVIFADGEIQMKTIIKE